LSFAFQPSGIVKVNLVPPFVYKVPETD